MDVILFAEADSADGSKGCGQREEVLNLNIKSASEITTKTNCKELGKNELLEMQPLSTWFPCAAEVRRPPEAEGCSPVRKWK